MVCYAWIFDRSRRLTFLQVLYPSVATLFPLSRTSTTTRLKSPKLIQLEFKWTPTPQPTLLLRAQQRTPTGEQLPLLSHQRQTSSCAPA
jgi:hypothetical protein